MSTESTQKWKTFGQRIGEGALTKVPVADWAGSLPMVKVQPSAGQLLPRFWGIFPWYAEIEAVVDALNGKGETPPILRKIVHAWWKSGPNLQKFCLANPKVRADADSFWSQRGVNLYWGDSGTASCWHTLLDERGSTPNEEAIRFFLLLITNPYANRLAGPCDRCGTYYIKKRASQKVYCSRRCGNATTATVRTREQRVQNHVDKLRRSRTAIQKWTRTRTKCDWKQWVSRREPDITPKFLTRAVNRGELKVPIRQ